MLYLQTKKKNSPNIYYFDEISELIVNKEKKRLDLYQMMQWKKTKFKDVEYIKLIDEYIYNDGKLLI